MGWILIRIRMDPELLPGSGTQKIQSWIRIRNKSFRIHNTGYKLKVKWTAHEFKEAVLKKTDFE